MRRRRRPKPHMVRQMLKDRRREPFAQVVIVPQDGSAAIGPFDTAEEADTHARVVGIGDYNLLTVVPPRARLRVV